jgi:hypothetical protein
MRSRILRTQSAPGPAPRQRRARPARGGAARRLRLKRARLTAPGGSLEVDQGIAGRAFARRQDAEIPAGDAVFGDVGGDALDPAAASIFQQGVRGWAICRRAVPSAKTSPMQAVFLGDAARSTGSRRGRREPGGAPRERRGQRRVVFLRETGARPFPGRRGRAGRHARRRPARRGRSPAAGSASLAIALPRLSPGSRPTRPAEQAADDDRCDQFHSQAAPLTPDESPWRCLSSRVATRSEKTCSPHRRGTFS